MIDPRIPMMGQNPDLFGSFARGQQVGQFVNDARHQNALRGAISEHGAGLVAGESGARNALAGFDPQMVMQSDAHRQGMDHNERKLQLAYQQANQQAQAMAAKLSAEQRAQIQQEYEQGLSVLSTAQSPEQWDEFARRLGIDGAVGDFENRSFWIAQGLAVKDAMGMNEGQQGESDPAKEQQIRRHMETGLDRHTAINITDGRYVISRDPVTGVAQVVDKATGQVVTPGAAEGAAQPPEQPHDGARSTAETTMPTGTDFSTATGAGGFVSQFANTLTDAVGAGLVDPNNETATQAMRNLQNRTMIALADSVAGRPSNFLLERFEQLTTTPNSIWQGQGRTRERLNQIRDMIAEGIALNDDVVQSEVTPQMRAEAQRNKLQLDRLLKDYDAVIGSFGRRENASDIPPPPASLSDENRELWQHMTPEQRKLWD